MALDYRQFVSTRQSIERSTRQVWQQSFSHCSGDFPLDCQSDISPSYSESLPMDAPDVI